MSVPKQRHTKTRRDRKKGRKPLSAAVAQKCAKCGKAVKAHHACPGCGFYRGKEIVNTLKKTKANQKSKK